MAQPANTKQSSRGPYLLGHRGARRYAAENTLAAFEQALSHGCDGFEFDVRLTADGRMIVCHDPELRGAEVGTSTYSQLVARGDDKPPLLEDVLRTFAARAYLDIELKVPGMEGKVAAALQQHPPRRGCVVSSFLPGVVAAMASRSAKTDVGLICDSREQLSRWSQLPVSHVIPKVALVSRELVERFHAAGKQVFVWTVNDRTDMQRLAEVGVDGFISDDTQLLARTLGGNALGT